MAQGTTPSPVGESFGIMYRVPCLAPFPTLCAISLSRRYRIKSPVRLVRITVLLLSGLHSHALLYTVPRPVGPPFPQITCAGRCTVSDCQQVLSRNPLPSDSRSLPPPLHHHLAHDCASIQNAPLPASRKGTSRRCPEPDTQILRRQRGNKAAPTRSPEPRSLGAQPLIPRGDPSPHLTTTHNPRTRTLCRQPRQRRRKPESRARECPFAASGRPVARPPAAEPTRHSRWAPNPRVPIHNTSTLGDVGAVLSWLSLPSTTLACGPFPLLPPRRWREAAVRALAQPCRP